MIRTHQRNLFWTHYLVLESDIDNISRFIEFSENNFHTYSIQLAHFLLAVGSEIDVLLKALCRMLDNAAKLRNMQNYKKVITDNLPGIIKQEVLCRKYGLRLTPWINWVDEERLEWWQAYNAVKHKRNIHFEEANLKNSLNAIAALYLLNVHYNHNLSQQETNYPLDLHYTIRNLEIGLGLFTINDWRLML